MATNTSSLPGQRFISGPDALKLQTRVPRLPDSAPKPDQIDLSRTTATFKHTPVSKLLQLISAGPEMPGCGSAAALNGALSAAVVAAAAVGTLHSKDHVEFHPRAEQIRALSTQYREELLSVVDSDAKIFSHWQELSHDDPAKVEALLGICRSPLRSAKIVLELVQFSLELLQQGADPILTDAATSFACGIGSVEANLCIAFANSLYLASGDRATFQQEIKTLRAQLVGFIQQRNIFHSGLGGYFAGLPLKPDDSTSSTSDSCASSLASNAGAPVRSSPA